MGLPPAEPTSFGINPKAHFPDISGPSQHTAPAACWYQGSAHCITAGYVCECNPYKHSKAVPLAAKYNFNVAPVPCGVAGLAVVSPGMPSTKAEELQKYRNTPEVTKPVCAVLAPQSRRANCPTSPVALHRREETWLCWPCISGVPLLHAEDAPSRGLPVPDRAFCLLFTRDTKSFGKSVNDSSKLLKSRSYYKVEAFKVCHIHVQCWPGLGSA